MCDSCICALCFQDSGASESKLAEKGHLQSSCAHTASAQDEPLPNDGATNTGTVETSAAAAVAETGATKAALPQYAPGSDGYSRMAVQSEASMDNQIGRMQTDRIENDSRSEHISKAELISSLEPTLTIDQGTTGTSGEVCSVLYTGEFHLLYPGYIQQKCL